MPSSPHARVAGAPIPRAMPSAVHQRVLSVPGSFDGCAPDQRIPLASSAVNGSAKSCQVCCWRRPHVPKARPSFGSRRQHRLANRNDVGYQLGTLVMRSPRVIPISQTSHFTMPFSTRRGYGHPRFAYLRKQPFDFRAGAHHSLRWQSAIGDSCSRRLSRFCATSPPTSIFSEVRSPSIIVIALLIDAPLPAKSFCVCPRATATRSRHPSSNMRMRSCGLADSTNPVNPSFDIDVIMVRSHLHGQISCFICCHE